MKLVLSANNHSQLQIAVPSDVRHVVKCDALRSLEACNTARGWGIAMHREEHRRGFHKNPKKSPKVWLKYLKCPQWQPATIHHNASYLTVMSTSEVPVPLVPGFLGFLAMAIWSCVAGMFTPVMDCGFSAVSLFSGQGRSVSFNGHSWWFKRNIFYKWRFQYFQWENQDGYAMIPQCHSPRLHL